MTCSQVSLLHRLHPRVTPAASQQEMELIAGFVGVKQAVDTSRLVPGIGWAVLEEDECARVFTRLAAAVMPS